MSNIGSLMGLSGLNANIDRRQQRQDEMVSLEKLMALDQSNKDRELAYQQQEQIAQDQISAKADELLAPDRAKLNELARKNSAMIADKVKIYGSHKGFFDNGGMNDLNNYKNSILNSQELGTYKANKINSERLISIQSGPNASFISLKDLQSMKDYDANGGGIITYSGLNYKIDIPEDSFSSGDVIPPEKIIYYNNNRLKIIGNFTRDFPDEASKLTGGASQNDIANDDALLANYMMQIGLIGRGKNNLMYAEKAKAAIAQATAKAKVTFSSLLGNYHRNMNTENIDLRLSNMDEKIDSSPIRNSLGNTPYTYAGVGSGSIAETVSKAVLDTAGYVTTVNFWSDETLGAKIPILNSIFTPHKATKTIIPNSVAVDVNFKGAKFENGVINTNLRTATGAVYNAFGTEVKGDETITGDFVPLGTFTGMKGIIGSGNNQSSSFIAMDKTNKKGDIDIPADRLYGDGSKNAQMKSSTFTAYQNKANGELYYVEVQTDTSGARSILANAMGEANNLETDYIEQAKDNNLKAQDLSYVKKQKELNNTENIKNLQGLSEKHAKVFNSFSKGSPYSFQVSATASSDGSQDRSSLIKAFYSAITKATPGSNLEKNVNQSAFETFVNVGNVKEQLTNYSIKEVDIIDNWVRAMNAQTNIDSTINDAEKQRQYDNHRSMADDWKNLLLLY